MISWKSLRLTSLIGPICLCCFAGCDPLYELNVVVANKAGEPLADVSYDVIAYPDRPKSKMNVGRGQTTSDGRVQWSTVGKCDLLLELEKAGFEKVSKKVEMEKGPSSLPVTLVMEEVP